MLSLSRASVCGFLFFGLFIFSLLWSVLGNDAKNAIRGVISAELLFARQSDPKPFMAYYEVLIKSKWQIIVYF